MEQRGNRSWRGGDFPQSVNTTGYPPEDALLVGEAFVTRAQHQVDAQGQGDSLNIKVDGSNIIVTSKPASKK